ncbi:D-isomer specific 2-hydroxyacid dehydrogenase,NAD-binding protein [Candidatus Competibacter denitrificans Run_A_D11]|uniref:D-isomer specific 2-hydroxyacid dehydrogenase,NAD-binding protein n=1 Tax=Candidatus Competibacter denitrificans Run_A_D11 TaxID=1400863 RepID=W6M5P5_9GAMM|nr:2-hydroxyacid dehydrogenase [Candidatus Competibacter denitrificans]CDI03052.1 D-isomer specific 2-hydroxyacid dehydrogenase,NAD-binding protein [Candidatus Competibacter denitrificans Run_A_D11]HAS85190.1 2-hydroxyacid dehydrogenase [Candidatus Competibacteraceae bacterium]HRC69281.1 2-hydroxyacid dehydrogenase [Candidatus Competibacter denitrificans]
MLGSFLDKDSLDCGDLDFSVLDTELPELTYYPATSPDQVAERIAQAEVVISNKVMLNAAAIQQAPRLRLICIAATGVNNVDLAAAEAAGITVCNCRGYGTPAVVQHVFALLLALYIRLPDYHQAVRAGRWQQASQFCLLDYPIRELADKTLGIVGYGELGRGVARVADAFGMRILLAQRPGTVEPEEGRIPLPVLLPQVDVLSLHCPLTPETRGLIGAWELALMRRDAILLNTARGGLVDEAVLADALRKGALGGAGIDVLSLEPPTVGNPLLAPDIPNLIVTPHSAWGSRESRQRMLGQLAENVREYRLGQPVRVVR